MRHPVFHAIAAVVLMALPVLAVHSIKQTHWGPVLASPITRQLGDPAARVVIVEYSDFQCPSCAKMQPTVHELLDHYKGKVRLAYKYYPLVRIHKNALTSAHAAECAAAQNKFFPYQDKLFDQQTQWAELTDPTTSFMAIARDVQADLPRFEACYQDPAKLAPVYADQDEGKERDVTATPTFFIGDARLVGTVLGMDGARTIERELRK